MEVMGISDWKIIERATKAKNEVVRSLRLPIDLDNYCIAQGNASDFIRELITAHMKGREIVELTDAEEAIRVALLNYYWLDSGLEWSRANFEAEKIYPPPEKISDAELDDLLEKITTLSARTCLRTDEDWDLVERCKLDRDLWRRVYAKVRSAELAIHKRDRIREEEEERRKKRWREWREGLPR
jgi:hypothetical protein